MHGDGRVQETPYIPPPARPPMRVLALPLALALLAAGCVALPADPASRNAAEALPFPDPMGQDHDHKDVTLHAHAWQFEQTSHHPLAGSSTRSSGAHALDVKAGWLFAAVYGGEADAQGGFFVFNLSDPAQPDQVGRFTFPGPLGGDRSLEATEDADFVLLGTEAIDCAGHVNPVAPGLYLVDVRDKADPSIAHYVPATMVHSVTVHRIDGVDYVFSVKSGQNVFRVVREPVPRLEAVAELPIAHDSVVMDDPLLGKPLLYASNGGAGFEIWDVSEPAAPKKLAAWNIPDRGDRYYIHTGAVAMLDGRRVVVVTSEDWEDYPSALWVLDATDLSLVETLSNWSAPGEHAADGLRYSMHNPRFMPDGTLVLSYYHGGVWALDLSTPERRAAPAVVGHFSPGESNGWVPEKPKTSAYADAACGVFHLADAPVAFDVEVGNGVVYVADLPTGLYTVKPLW